MLTERYCKCSVGHLYVVTLALVGGVGCTVSTSSGGHVHVYPFNHKKPDGPLRSAKSHKQYCSDALSTAQTVRCTVYET